MIHPGKYLHMGFRAQLEQVFHLRLGYESLFCAVPEMDIRPVDGIQLIGVDIFVTVPYGFAFAVWPYLLAFIQQYVEVMRMEHPPPEACPVVAGPYIEALVISQRIDAPFGNQQQGLILFVSVGVECHFISIFQNHPSREAFCQRGNP